MGEVVQIHSYKHRMPKIISNQKDYLHWINNLPIQYAMPENDEEAVCMAEDVGLQIMAGSVNYAPEIFDFTSYSKAELKAKLNLIISLANEVLGDLDDTI